MSEENFEKTPHKAARWFRAFIVLALLYGITYSLHSIFNWVFFLFAAYSLFMSYFTLPVQPKIFQKQAKPFNGGGRTSYTSPPSATQLADRGKKIVRIIIFSVAGVFALFMLIGIFAGNNDDGTTTTTTTDEQSSDDPPESNEAEALTFKGNDFINNSNPDSADWYYDEALDLDPDFMMAVYGKGLVLYNKGNRDEAYTYFTKAYQGGYRYGWLSWVLADGYDKNGDAARAIELYKESINLDSTFTDSYNRLAELEPDNKERYLELSRKHPSTN
ncbi:MAG: tetratricopeptide repeat protein [Bacteroidota bacterium]